MRTFMVIVLLLITCTSCTGNTSKANEEQAVTGNPTATEILSENNQADIFQYNDLVYLNASTSKNIKSEQYKKGRQITEITKQTIHSKEFKNGTASKLPEGTEIHQIAGEGLHMLMIHQDGEDIIYIALIER